MTSRALIAAATAVAALGTGVASAAPSGSWSTAVKIDTVAGNHPDLNTASLDGCPILSPDGRKLYMASNRPDGDSNPDLNIWVATRESVDAPFGAPERLPNPINSAANDFCPTPVRGGGLFFVSNRDGGCGLGDIYFTRYNPDHGWREPRRLACDPEGPNSGLDEQGPSRVEISDGVSQLFFSRSSGSVPGDIFVSTRHDGGRYGPASAVTELNSAGNDLQPNIRKDGREIVLSSNHGYPGAQGAQDIYVSTRASTDDPWSTPVNLGPAVNTIHVETRPSLSWDARTLLFGRAPNPNAPAPPEGAEGSADIYMSTR